MCEPTPLPLVPPAVNLLLMLTTLNSHQIRTARSRGYDIIYEARDEALPQACLYFPSPAHS